MAYFRNALLLALTAVLVAAGGCAALAPSPWAPTGETMPQSAARAPLPGAAARRTTSAPGGNASESAAEGATPTVRGQSPAYSPPAYAPPASAQPAAGYPAAGYPPAASNPLATMPDGSPRGPQPISGGAPPVTAYAPAAAPQPSYAFQPPAGAGAPPLPPPPPESMPAIPGGISPITPGYPGFQPPSNFPPEIPATPTPLDVFVEETRTGQFMFGVTVNSNAGLVGNIVVSERNFDITRVPTSWDEFANGTAFRGAGQGFRIEAQPGTVLQRYLVSLTEPYFLGTNVSFDSSGYYYNRLYFDWTETRVGGRLAWGYRLTPDLSLAGALRMEDVNIFNPRVKGVPELDSVLGHNDIYSGRVTMTHDTRDIPFSPTQGHLVTGSFEQAFGEFSFPRGDFEWHQYFLVRQRPDGSGRHTAAFITKLGVSGTDTPIFENYFAGGYSTIRGFQFRGAAPQDMGVTVGGRFQWLNSLEYYFPLTADDMIRGTVFCDFGTVEKNVALHTDQFRVAPGFGLRINIPAMGPAPLAFDFAFPVASASTDHKQVFSFFMGATR